MLVLLGTVWPSDSKCKQVPALVQPLQLPVACVVLLELLPLLPLLLLLLLALPLEELLVELGLGTLRAFVLALAS